MSTSFGSSHYKWYILKLLKNCKLIVETSIEISATAERFSSLIPSKKAQRISLDEQCSQNLDIK